MPSLNSEVKEPSGDSRLLVDLKSMPSCLVGEATDNVQVSELSSPGSAKLFTRRNFERLLHKTSSLVIFYYVSVKKQYSSKNRDQPSISPELTIDI